MKPITQTIALYREITYDYTIVANIDSSYEDNKDYVRLTEPYEITLTPRKEYSVQADMIENLLLKLEETNSEHDVAVDNLNERINELRALPAPQEAA